MGLRLFSNEQAPSRSLSSSLVHAKRHPDIVCAYTYVNVAPAVM
jgi:hypothetical protein